MSTTDLDLDEDKRGFRLLRGRANTAFWMAIILIALMAFFSIATPNHAFFQVSNFQAMGRDAAIGILLAVGMTYVLGAGHLDLSVGANLVLASVLGAQTTVALGPHAGLGADLGLGLLVCLVVGAGMGAINGLLVTKAKVNSFVTTLATTGIATGATLVLASGTDVPGVPPEIQLNFGVVNLAGIPLTIVIIAPIVIVLWVALIRSRYGIRTVAIGSDQESAIRAGINVNRHVFSIFILSGTLAGVAGFLDITRFGSTDILGHTSDSLAAIAAVVIGGSSLFGGRASIGGSLVGACIPIVLGTGLVIAGLPSYYQQAVVGVILLVAVYLDQRRRSRSVG
jgi:ribose transport system permease protein